MLSPCLFNLYAKYIMRNAGLDEALVGIKIAWRNISNLRYADNTTLTAESEELKSLLMEVKEESEKVDLKLNIQKTEIMTPGPITSWQIDGETMEALTDFTLGGALKSLDFPGGSDGKVSAYNARDPGSISGLGRSPGEGNGNPLLYSFLENPIDGEAW